MRHPNKTAPRMRVDCALSNIYLHNSYYKSIKISLKNILKNPETDLEKINDAVIRINQIVIHTLQFLKLYLLHYYENNEYTLPMVDKKFIGTVMKNLVY